MTLAPVIISEKNYLQDSRSQFKQALRSKIKNALWTARNLPADVCLSEIRRQLSAIQIYCECQQKKFVFVEELIVCSQFDLGGSDRHSATLFRGPCEKASVAICVTQNGSLLHRNDSPWRIYRDAGDVKPMTISTARNER